jgi:serine/threonine protein kinase
MDRAPDSTFGNFPLEDAQPSGHRENPVRESFADPFTLETIAASASTANPSMGSPILALLGRRYDILGEAGRGAMGRVYKACDRETGETVALKLLKPEIASDPKMVERFKSELLFARRITHKNVCRVYEFNRVDGIAYMSMEFVEGESLRCVLRRFGSMAPRKGIDVALQMCAGLKEAHRQGIVHRDLKPENVMIDTQGNVKVMDFGIAHSMEAFTLLTGSLVGTPAYMAPEQAAGKTVDYRADIYALGLMMYEMFTGTQPFHAENAVALALKHMQESPRPPREIEPSISSSVENTILKCIEKPPEKRFQSIAELEAALRSQLPTPSSDWSTPGISGAAANYQAESAVALSSATVSTAQPSPQKASRAGFIAVTIAIVGTLALGLILRGRAPKDVAPRTVSISKNSLSTMPNASVVATLNPSPAMTHEAAKRAPSLGAKLQKVPEPALEDAAVASAAPVKSSLQAGPVALTASVTATPTASSRSPAAPSESSDAGQVKRGGYVFVNRFPHQLGAENAAKKVEDMGLRVTVIPRHNPLTDKDFFVVLSGPYSAAKIDKIIEQLREGGFAEARPNKEVVGHVDASPGTPPSPAP